MREVSYVLTQLFNGEQIKNLNNTIGNNLIKANDNPNTEAIKTSSNFTSAASKATNR